MLLLDGRTIEPTESGILHELSRQLKIRKPTLGGIVRALSQKRSAVAIVLDSYEVLGLLDAWLRQVLLGRLGKSVRLDPGEPVCTRAPVDREPRMAGIVPSARAGAA